MIISENMSRLVAGSSMIRKLFEEGLAMAEEVGSENVYDYSLGNPAADVPPQIHDTIIKLLEEESPFYLHGYMKNAGFDEVRAKVADHLNGKHGTDYTADDILMIGGAAAGINAVFRALLGYHDEVIVFAPFFGEYASYVSNYGGDLVVVPAQTDDFQLNLDALPDYITAKTRCVIVNNPNNPSGVIYTEETIKRLGEILTEAEERIGHPIFVVADEPYRELAYDGKTVPYLPNIIKNSVYVYSFSKTLSLPGERIGYLALKKSADHYDELMGALVVAHRVLGFINAPSLFQLVVGECLDIPADVAFYDKNRRLLYDSLSEMGFTVVNPEGAFYMLVKSPLPDEEDFVAAGKRQHIIMVSTKTFGLSGYVRLAYCVSYDMIERSLPAFRKLAAETLGNNTD